jgi:hypothetical protein
MVEPLIDDEYTGEPPAMMEAMVRFNKSIGG